MEDYKVLVNLIDIKTENKIRCYWTTNFSETLKMYNYAKEANIDIEIGSVDNSIENKLIENFFDVEKVTIRFGDDINLTCINVYVEVF